MNRYLEVIKESLEANIDKADIQYFYIGKPFSLGKAQLDRGVCIVQPIDTDIESVTTGIRDQETHTVRIIIAKQSQEFFVKNAEKHSAAQFLTRVCDGRKQDKTPEEHSVRYVIRNNYRCWSIMQPNIRIEYGTNELENVAQGIIEATITVTLTDIHTQQLG
jgi:hypothetical protein